MAGYSKYTGADKALRDLKKIRAKAPEIFGEALKTEITKVEVPECKKVTPVGETGNLRDGIHAEGPFYEGKKIRVTVVTGPEADDYALIQHEDLELFHEVGDAKFIERPLNESAPHLPARVAARIDLKKALS